jgi:hypothetical protein
MKNSMPVIATADAQLIRKVISFYLDKNTTNRNEKEQEHLLKVFHRLGRLNETGR